MRNIRAMVDDLRTVQGCSYTSATVHLADARQLSTVLESASIDAVITSPPYPNETELTCYSIQNHLRTTVTNIGQVEVDKIYVGLNKRGTHFILPCQAKSKGDKFGIVQVRQDISLCLERYPNAICRPIALQFVGESKVAMLEFTVREEDEILKLNIVEEKQYELVQRIDVSDGDLYTA